MDSLLLADYLGTSIRVIGCMADSENGQDLFSGERVCKQLANPKPRASPLSGSGVTM